MKLVWQSPSLLCMLWFKSHPGLFWGVRAIRLTQAGLPLQGLAPACPGRMALISGEHHNYNCCVYTESLLRLSLHLSHNCSFILGLNTWTLKSTFLLKIACPLGTLRSSFFCVIFCKSSYKGLVLSNFEHEINSMAFHVPNESHKGMIRKKKMEKKICSFLDSQKKKSQSSCLWTREGFILKAL